MRKILLLFMLIITLMLGIPMGIVSMGKIDFKNIGGKASVDEKKENEKPNDKVENNKEEKAPINIKIYNVKEEKMLTMELEEYIKCVVSSEMPASFHDEALKSQAVAARSFLISKLPTFGGKPCPKANGGDICSEVHCQAFATKESKVKQWGEDGSSKWDKISKAVDETRGMILTYNGEIASQVKYHSTSGGKTEDSVAVFGYSHPYLKSVESKGEEAAPNFKSTVKMKKEDFVKAIRSKHTSAKIEPAKLDSQVKIIERTEGDRVKSINVGGKILSGVDVRELCGLKSAAFDIEFDKYNIIFNVSGYGHGVGMSQWGANEMGKTGKKYNEILTHYYTGTKIEDYSGYIK